MKKIRYVVVFLTTIIIFYLLSLKIDINELFLNLGSIKVSYLLLALVISTIFNIFICAYKLKIEIKILGAVIPFKESLFIKVSSYLLALISPFQLGEIINAFYLRNMHKFKFTKGIGVVVINRVMSGVGLLFFVFIGLSFFLGLYYSLLIFTILAFILLFLKYILRFLSKKIRIKDYLRRVTFKSLLYLVLVSIIVELSKIINIFIFFRAFNIEAPMAAIILFTSLAALISSIPITISGFGTREASIIYLFAKYASSEILLSVGLLLSFVECIFPAAIGLFTVHKFLKKSVIKSS